MSAIRRSALVESAVGVRIIRLVEVGLGSPESMDELKTLRKGDSRMVICAKLVKGYTWMTNGSTNGWRHGFAWAIIPPVSAG